MSVPDRAQWARGTRTVHHPDAEVPSRPVATPLYQSSTFQAQRAATVAQYAEQIQPQAFYTRWGNPTVEVWEKVMADLEGGQRCLAFASGMAAVSTTLLGLLERGDHVVAGSSLYTATTRVLAEDLPQLGIQTDFVDPADPGSFERAARPATRMFYVESPTNPTLGLGDLAALGDVARRRGITMVVDNTFATPINQRPLALGAHVVIHSATKYLSGHSDVVAGCVVTDTATAERLWHKRTLLGTSLDPFAAWLLLRGMKTLAVRVSRQNENALAVARALERHPAVRRVIYPGLRSHPQHALACRQMDGFGGMVAFEVRGGRQAGTRLVESTRLALLAVSLGGVETLIEHPASMSHAMLDDDQLQRAGIPPGLIRLSVGIEDPDDLIADLRCALDQLS
ncbi:MAG TPA: aminotransferase class I/II-fold pyridoxal phosphate-dependent enzyme [Planctomycetaceae bacterium]|nr:aminotransferase class I/II-fold pyridoxal phosphate-dependent enzyme [Planctomycetaceae bacterium]HIQ22419.1 aminotransferase class I/II-fold pyridoxal phosphate-dependent enzyme [Planctomycetota bacterium]